MTEIRPEKRQPVKTAAFILGLAGLVPFFAAAFLALRYQGDILLVAPRQAGLAYGAIILSFLGGIRWGLALAPVARLERVRDLGASVLPALLGWACLLMPLTLGFGFLIAGFALQYAWDFESWRRGHLPGWFHSLRMILSVGAIASLFILALQPAIGLPLAPAPA